MEKALRAFIVEKVNSCINDVDTDDLELCDLAAYLMKTGLSVNVTMDRHNVSSFIVEGEEFITSPDAEEDEHKDLINFIVTWINRRDSKVNEGVLYNVLNEMSEYTGYNISYEGLKCTEEDTHVYVTNIKIQDYDFDFYVNRYWKENCIKVSEEWRNE